MDGITSKRLISMHHKRIMPVALEESLEFKVIDKIKVPLVGIMWRKLKNTSLRRTMLLDLVESMASRVIVKTRVL